MEEDACNEKVSGRGGTKKVVAKEAATRQSQDSGALLRGLTIRPIVQDAPRYLRRAFQRRVLNALGADAMHFRGH